MGWCAAASCGALPGVYAALRPSVDTAATLDGAAVVGRSYQPSLGRRLWKLPVGRQRPCM